MSTCNDSWPVTVIIVSLIWAVAWVLRARFEYGPYTQNEGFELEEEKSRG